MNGAGYDVADGPPIPNVAKGGDSKFRSLVTDAMRAPGANAGRVEVELATIDANCLEQTVVPARTAVRTPARVQFIQTNAQAFRSAEEDLVAAAQQLSDTSGIPFTKS
jgi:hypothetical protein